MKKLALVALAVVGFWAAATPAEGQSKIADIVRSSGGEVEFTIEREFSPADLADLVQESDLVARVLIGQSRGRLSADERRIETDYTGQVLERYVSRKPASIEENILLVRPGGVVTVGTRMVSATERDFPPFQIGEEYLLFLRFDRERKTYILPRGAQSAFRLTEGLAEQVATSEGKIKAERGALRSEALTQEIRELGGRQ